MDTLTFYVVRSKDGKYLRSKGYGGYGQSWVDDIKKAKVWNKIGPANAQVTWWARSYPEYGIPDVIPFVATAGEPLNQDDRVKKALKKIELGNLQNKLHQLQERYDKAVRENQRHKSHYSNVRLMEATEDMQDIENEIQELKNN